jgi:hypothetical protein
VNSAARSVLNNINLNYFTANERDRGRKEGRGREVRIRWKNERDLNAYGRKKKKEGYKCMRFI